MNAVLEDFVPGSARLQGMGNSALCSDLRFVQQRMASTSFFWSQRTQRLFSRLGVDKNVRVLLEMLRALPYRLALS